MDADEASRARSESAYLEGARGLAKRAHALGATLVAFGPSALAFRWDDDALEGAIEFVCSANRGGPPVWAFGLARGTMESLATPAGVGAAERANGAPDLAWGRPLLRASMLSGAARPGEAVVDAEFPGLDALVATGKRSAHDGESHVRGIRIDVRQPWKRDVGSGVERLSVAPFTGRPDVGALLSRPGVVHVLRADPGRGGTRMLAEIARAVAPAPCLVVAPAGASVEPLGALRRALVRAFVTRPYPDDPELAPALDMFLGGIGASIEQAATIVAALMRSSSPSEPPGALLLDDAGEIDGESLEACAHVVASMPSPFHVFVRIDATDRLPGLFASLPPGKEIELAPLDRAGGEAVARGATSGALTLRAASRIARRASFIPLAVTEALSFALTTGDVVWIGDRAALRTAASLAGKPRTAARWIAKRAKATAPDERGVLATVALLGGEAPLETVVGTLKLVDASIQTETEVKKLLARHWLEQTLPGWVALPSRTHRDTIAELLDEAPRRALNRAIADVLERSEGELGCAEAAHHAVKAGDGERAARLALRSARAAQAAGMAKSASRLLTLARLADPKCEPITRQQLLTSLPPPILPPSRPPSSSAQPLILSDSVPSLQPVAPSSLPPMRFGLDDGPTERVSPVTAGQAARLLHALEQEPPSSEMPTLHLAPAPPKPPPAGLLERPTEPEPMREPGLRLPPSIERPNRPELRPSSRGFPAVMPRPLPAEPPAIPEPAASFPLRQSPPSAPPSTKVVTGRASEPGMPRVVIAKRVAPPLGTATPGRALSPSTSRPPPVLFEDDEKTLHREEPRAAASPGAAAHVGSAPAMVPPVPAGTAMGVPAVSPSAIASPRPVTPPPLSSGLPAALAPLPPPSPSSPPEAAASHGDDPRQIARRMVDLARAALLGGDADGIDRWTEGLRAAGGHDRLADRLEAVARLTRGQVDEALRALRGLETGTAASSPANRAQVSLALGLALAAANRPDEALLAGLEALARAREAGGALAIAACLAFLARLYDQTERADEATALRGALKPPERS